MAPQLYFDKSLERLRLIFSCSGNTFESKKFKSKTKLKYRFIYILNFCWLNTDVIGAMYWFINGIREGIPFVEVTYNAPCTVYCYVANIKAFFLTHYEDHINDLIDNLRNLEAKHVDEGQETEAIKKDDTDFLHGVLKASNILYVVLIITFTISPIILIALKYFKTKEVELILPFLIIYPFDSHDIRYWPFVFAHQFWSMCIVLLNFSGADYLLYICCTYLRIQFRLLRHDIEKLVGNNCVLSERDLDIFQDKCVTLIQWHQELIRLVGVLEHIYAKSTLFNFVCSSILICLTGFNVMAIENLVFNVSFLVFLSVVLLQIFLLCFFGDLLMKSSMEICDAVYNCKWYDLNSKGGKTLLIVQTRAQKPCKLTAFDFSDVNLRAFMGILSSAWSYFALLKTVYTPTNN